MFRYPRDMNGYGPTSPNVKWPNGAKIAVQIVLNYEEGGENNVLHGDECSEAFLSEITGANPWPGQRHWNMESIYEYGSRVGFWRIHQLLKETPVTVFGVTTALARAPEQVAAMKNAGWEIACHGLKWVEHKDMSKETERTQIETAVRQHTEIVGQPPKGWYTGRCSMNTVDLVAEHGGFEYVADSYADDLPYWLETTGKRQLVVPYTMDCNDMRFAIQAGFSTGEQFEKALKDAFDILYEEGQSGKAQMMSIGLHCRIVGRPSRFAAFKRALDYIRSHEGVWFATRLQIARHWAANHPLVPALQPSAMNKDEFLSAFGDIFEHSPWVAAEAFELELGPAHDTAAGIHSALTRVFRSASAEKRLSVLNAHPDLAGKLAQAGRLTADSTAEQAGAGLDQLTDEERKQFSDLNARYMAKFGFPFIIAVKDNTKKAIGEAFLKRLSNTREDEYLEACMQVERIAELRLIERFTQWDVNY